MNTICVGYFDDTCWHWSERMTSPVAAKAIGRSLGSNIKWVLGLNIVTISSLFWHDQLQNLLDVISCLRSVIKHNSRAELFYFFTEDEGNWKGQTNKFIVYLSRQDLTCYSLLSLHVPKQSGSLVRAQMARNIFLSCLSLGFLCLLKKS